MGFNQAIDRWNEALTELSVIVNDLQTASHKMPESELMELLALWSGLERAITHPKERTKLLFQLVRCEVMHVEKLIARKRDRNGNA